MVSTSNKLFIEINGTAKDFIEEVDKVKKQTQSLEKTLTTTAKVSAITFAAFAASIVLVTKSFADYEKALVGVGKTTNIEGKKLQKFGTEFKKLSSEIPVTTNELLGIAQAAGQLGVSGEENLLVFTETIAKLGVATDLTGEQAATALTRILNVTGESISSIDKFGSVIVALGNNFAATESEIVKVTTEVARSTAVFDVSAGKAAAIATALKSLGVQAQLGGSAVGRGFREIDAAIRAGGTELENLADITGIAGDQLKQTFEKDSVSVFQAFVEGLGKIDAAGGSTTEALAAFGLKGDEILKVLPVLAKNSTILGDALSTVAEETKNATALNTEAEKAFATLASSAQITANNFENLKANIGEQLAPAVTSLLSSLNVLLKNLSELDTKTVSNIAGFLKFGAALTASIATIATFAIGLLKVRQLIRGLTIAFKASRLAVIGFTSAATFGLSAVLAFLPEIIEGVSSLVKKFGDSRKPKALEQINEELRKTKKIRDEIASAPDVGFVKKDAQLDKYDAEIKKLEELRQARIKASGDFGTGEVLQQKVEGPGDFSIPGIPEQTIPLKAEEVQDDSNESLRESQAEKTAIIDEATQKRIDATVRENENLKALQTARLEGANQEELEALSTKQEIEDQFAEAKLIKDEEQRALALENLRLKHEEELEELAAFDEMKAERDAEKLEQKTALEASMRDLDKKQTEKFTKEDQKALAQKFKTRQQVEKQVAMERVTRQAEERNQFLKDETKYGTSIANLKQFFNKDEVQGFKQTSTSLATLAKSKNSTMKGIGKAAARTNAAIATAEGAIKAYTSLSGIPIVGPVLGAAAAAALVSYGVEQQSAISAMQTGGFVPGAQGGARDRVPTMLEPGELVVPASVAPNFIQAAGIPDTQAVDSDEGQGASVIEIMLEDRAGEVISLEQREGRALGLI